MTDINSLLDATLDDLADFQKFEPFPAGDYRFQLSWELPDDDEVVIVVMKLKNLECLDVPGIPEESLPAVGKESTFWMRLQKKNGENLTWEDGTPNTQDQGRFKDILRVLAPIFNPNGSLSNRELMEASAGCELLGTLKVKASKKDKDVKFNEIKQLVIAE